jgi:hypothetical protein
MMDLYFFSVFVINLVKSICLWESESPLFGFAAIRRKLSQKLEYKNKIFIVQTIVEIDFTKLITKTEKK